MIVMTKPVEFRPPPFKSCNFCVVNVFFQIMSGLVKIHPTNRRGRSSLWLMQFMPWLMRYITCTKISVLEKLACAPRWRASMAHCCSSTFAMSTSQVCIPNSTTSTCTVHECSRKYLYRQFCSIVSYVHSIKRNQFICTKAIFDICVVVPEATCMS